MLAGMRRGLIECMTFTIVASLKHIKSKIHIAEA
jgi:hypothetical protein